MGIFDLFRKKTTAERTGGDSSLNGLSHEKRLADELQKRDKTMWSLQDDYEKSSGLKQKGHHHSRHRPSKLYGAIIGDIIGSKYEFNNIKTKDFPLLSAGCSYTDDTIMTIAVARALINSKANKESFRALLIQEMRSLGKKYPHPQGGYGSRFTQWLNSSHPAPYKSCGNGSAMRVSPCGLYAVELEEALELAEISASVTHNHSEGIKGAKAVAAAVFLAKQGKDKNEIKTYIESNFYPLRKSIEEIRNDYAFDETCQGTVPQAIQAFLESVSFEDAVRNAVSIGGDSDTIAAITGSIAWVYYYDIIKNNTLKEINAYLPEEFIETIRLFDKVQRMREDYYFRMTDNSGIHIYSPTRVGTDHSCTREETIAESKIQLWCYLSSCEGKVITANNTAEYYCIATDGTVFKKEKDIFYRLDLEKMVWQRDDSIIEIWNGSKFLFQEFQDFEDYFPIVH